MAAASISHLADSIGADLLREVRRIVPGVTDSTAFKEIIRRYTYLHNEIGQLQEADHLMKFWRGIAAAEPESDSTE